MTLDNFQINLEQCAMEEILKFGEFSSLLNKSHSANPTDKNENSTSVENDSTQKEETNRDESDSSCRERDNYGCQVENGQDIV